jgi:hypothetical protein
VPPSAAAASDSAGGSAAAAAPGDPPAAAALEWALKQLDLAAMMGGPRFRPDVDAAAAAVEAALAAAAPLAPPAGPGTQQQQQQQEAAAAGAAGSAGDAAGAAPPPPEPLRAPLFSELPAPPPALPPGALSDPARRVPVAPPPALEAFLLDYMLAPDHGRPLVIRGAMEGWPALARWQDPAYLARVAGRRTVPVEVHGCGGQPWRAGRAGPLPTCRARARLADPPASLPHAHCLGPPYRAPFPRTFRSARTTSRRAGARSS